MISSARRDPRVSREIGMLDRSKCPRHKTSHDAAPGEDKVAF